MVACSVALNDISKLLRQVPSMQPLCRRTSESQEQPPELLGPKDAEVEVSGDHAWSPLLTNRHASWGILPQRCHRPALRWRRRSRPEWLSTVCRRHRYRLVLGSPRAHPSWTSRNRSIRCCGQSELSRRKQRQLPRPLLLLTSAEVFDGWPDVAINTR